MFTNSKANINNSLNKGFYYSYKLLNKKERARLRNISIFAFLSGILEIISLTTVYPLVSIIIEPDLINNNLFLKQIHNYLDNPNPNQFVILLALGASIILVTSVIMNLITQIMANIFASAAEERLAKEFYKDLIYAPYKWHLSNNPNALRTIILTNINLWNRSIIKIIPSLSGQLSGIIFALITILIATPKLGLVLF